MPAIANQERQGLLLVLASAVAYGSMPILARVAYARGVGVAGLLAWRFAIATALLVLLAPRRGAPPPPAQRARLLGLGLVFVGNSLAYFLALSRVPVAMLTLLLYTYPVMVTLLSALAGVDPLTPRNLVAAGLACAGAALTAGSLEAADPLGVWLALAAALLYSCYVVLVSRLARDVPSEVAARHVCAVALVAYLGWALRRGELVLPASPAAMLAVLGVGAFSTVFALRAFLAGLARVGPSRAAVLSSVEVIVTLGLAAVALGEPLPPRLLAGGALVLGAALLQHLGRREARG